MEWGSCWSLPPKVVTAAFSRRARHAPEDNRGQVREPPVDILNLRQRAACVTLRGKNCETDARVANCSLAIDPRFGGCHNAAW
jgi:hypothetical protein